MALKFSSYSIICSSVLIELYHKYYAIMILGKNKDGFLYVMTLELLLLLCVTICCVGVRLSPMENNDKLQDITSLYVAEWQWESWPVKQELSEQEGRTPGQRKNVALWRDSSKSAWYLFGGQPINGDPKKVYLDVWKFTVKTRVWKRVFPSQDEVKKTLTNKKDVSGVNQISSGTSQFDQISHNRILCGGLSKKNSTNSKNLSIWSSFRRKKFEVEKNYVDLSYLAIYAPKSNSVWQIDVKKKFWTAYVCSSNTTENKTEIKPGTSSIVPKEKTSHLSQHSDKIMNESYVFDSKINKAEDKAENEQQHFNDMKIKKKKINQIRKNTEKVHLKQLKIEKKSGSKKEKKLNETKLSGQGEGDYEKNEKASDTMSNAKKEKQISKSKVSLDNSENKPRNSEKLMNIKITARDCPEFEDETTMAWCDGRNEAFIIADIDSPLITLHVFNLTLNQWSSFEVINGEELQNCADHRYAGNEEEVYIICSQSNKTMQNLSNPSEIPSDSSYNIKLAYKINYKDRKLYNLGRIPLNPYFNSIEGDKVWQNDTQSVLEVLTNSDNDTILILAYVNVVDLWILNKNSERFELTEKLWRGSALKWFDKYNAPLYSLQFVSESEKLETILLLNPRNIEASEYWPRERGRFIIRIFKNENLKNETFQNRTRDQNLTYQLLQSDYKPSGGDNQLKQMYSLKVLVFFGISLAMFTIFGFVVFLKRCVSCPPRIQIRNECQKSPLIIRYSVIPDDLLYPVA